MTALEASVEHVPELVVARQLLHQAYQNLLDVERVDPAQFGEVVELYRNVIRWFVDRRPGPPVVGDLARLHLLVSLFQAGDDEALRALSVDPVERRGVQAIHWFLSGRVHVLDLVVDTAAHDHGVARSGEWIEVQLVRQPDGRISIGYRDLSERGRDHTGLCRALRGFFDAAPSNDR